MKKFIALFVLLVGLIIPSYNTEAQSNYIRDSLHLIATQPEPRTYVTSTICSGIDLPDSIVNYKTYPYSGINVDGARSLMLIADWDGFTGHFEFEISFVNSISDTMLTTFPINRQRIDSVKVRQELDGVPYDEGISYMIPSNFGIFQGFVKITIYGNDAVDIENLRFRIRALY